MNKILILTGIFPPDIGGPIAQIVPLADELVKRGWQVGVLTYGAKDEVRYSFEVRKVSKKNPLKNLVYLLKGIFWASKFDVIYSWDLYSAGLTGLAIKKMLGKKVVNRFAGDSAWEKAALKGLVGGDDVLTFQDKEYSCQVENWKERRKKILVNSDKVIVVSNFLKKVAMKIGVPEEKIEVVYNSVDMVKGDVKKDSEGSVLLTAARLVPWKGIDMLIEIMPVLVEKHEAKLVIAGSGPEEGKLKQLIQKHGLEGKVILTGKLSRSELAEQMKKADLFLLNTNYEGMSHTILEAMKIGLPVITTPAGGNPETIIDKETGLLVNYMDRRQWLSAIDNLLNDRELARKMAYRAKESLFKFNWDNLVEKTLKVLKSL